jgi:predicted nucleic acid-binding Zn ribbon protein
VTERLMDILERSNSAVAWTIRSCRQLEIWQKVVDERVARQTEAVKIKNKVLYVLTTTSTWAQELTLLKRDIINKFNLCAGEEAINDVRFRASGEKDFGRN